MGGEGKSGGRIETLKLFLFRLRRVFALLQRSACHENIYRLRHGSFQEWGGGGGWCGICTAGLTRPGGDGIVQK